MYVSYNFDILSSIFTSHYFLYRLVSVGISHKRTEGNIGETEEGNRRWGL